MAKGKHAKESRCDGRRIIVSLMMVLIVVQILMINDAVREKISIVDYIEGRQAGIEKK